MNAQTSEAIQDPLSVVHRVIASQSTIHHPSNNVSHPHAVAQAFRRIFDADEKIEQIPSLTHPATSVKSLRPETLVRFRCMIQDTGLGGEFYPADISDGVNWIYREPTLSGVSLDPTARAVPVLQDREMLYATEIPGEGPWVRALLDGPSEHGLERAMDNLNVAEPDCDPSFRRADVHEMESTRNKFPIEGKKHTGAILKMYDDGGNPLVKTAGAIEVIGVLGWTNFQFEVDLDQEKAPKSTNLANDQAAQPTALFPCVHVVFCRPPPIPRIPAPLLASTRSLIRDRLINYLASTYFLGDSMVAQYLLAAMIAKVHTRLSGFAVGTLPLNLIYNTGSEDSASLSDLMSLLLPQTTTINLTIESLNAKPLFPVANQESVNAGPLQLAPGTMLLIDSMAMDEGQLDFVGVKNVEAINKLVEDGKLLYSFPYSSLEFDADTNIILFSKGCKTFLSGFWSVPISNCSRRGVTTPALAPNEEELSSWRALIQDSRSRQITIPEALSSEVQDTFVSARKGAATASEADKAMSQRELGQRLELARLIGLQLGKAEVEREDWHEACKLEKLRKIQLSS